jgi:hypothetical protein
MVTVNDVIFKKKRQKAEELNHYFASIFPIKENYLQPGKNRTNSIKRNKKSKIVEKIEKENLGFK